MRTHCIRCTEVENANAYTGLKRAWCVRHPDLPFDTDQTKTLKRELRTYCLAGNPIARR